MEMLLLISLSLLWVMFLINQALTLRLLRWVRATNEARMTQQPADVERQELIIGSPAPEFKARTLTNQSVRLDSYAGHSVAFIFVSPACGHCRMEMPMLIKLATLAKKNADVEIILVSDWGPSVTQQWIDNIHVEDNVNVTLPILVAPPKKSDFLNDYNPRYMVPSFCLLDAQSIVQAKGTLPSTEWNKLKRDWEGVPKLMFNRYQ